MTTPSVALIARATIAGLALLTTVVLLATSLVEAEQARKLPRIGVLQWYSSGASERFVVSFRDGLHKLGYVEGQNIAIEWRWSDERSDRAAALAVELVRLGVDVIVAANTPAVQAAKNATPSIPIVMTGVADPVSSGLVVSLAKPGRNITGTSNNQPELAGKQLESLREVLPGISRVAFLAGDTPPSKNAFVQSTQAAAERLGIRIQTLMVSSADEIEGVFSAMLKERASAVIVQPILSQHFRQILKLAAQHRLPAISWNRPFADAGGLMSYGANVSDTHYRAAYYVDKILKGAKPADLPVEQPTKFELIVNLKTARALGLTIPPALLLRADQVIDQ